MPKINHNSHYVVHYKLNASLHAIKNYVVRYKLNALLHAIKNLENPNLLTSINELEAIKSKNTYQHDVLSVLKWFNTYYTNCTGDDEQAFIRKYIHKIIESPHPRKVLDTLCLLYYYKLHKSQDQLNNEFLSLKLYLEKSKQNNFLGENPQMSIEAYLDIILKNKHCKNIANILAIMNQNNLLNQKEVNYLFKDANLDFELLEKCLVKLNNKFITTKDFLLTEFIRKNYNSVLGKLKQLIYTSQNKKAKKIFLLLDKFSSLTVKNIALVLNTKSKEKKRLWAKLSILSKQHNTLTKETIEQFLTAFYAPKNKLKNLRLNTDQPLKNKLSSDDFSYPFDHKHNYLKRYSPKPPQLGVQHKKREHHPLKPKLSTIKILTNLFLNPINQFIRKLRFYLENYKNKKTVEKHYQIIIKKLTQTTDIKRFAKILCDIDLVYGEIGYSYSPSKQQRSDSKVKNLISTLTKDSPHADVLNWLNSNYYRYSKLEEKKFIQQHLNKILAFTSPKKALHAVWMLYYCSFHTEKQFNVILASEQAHFFITLFLEKLDRCQGKTVGVLKKEIQSDLDRLSILSTTLKPDNLKLNATQCKLGFANIEPKQTRLVSFFPFKNESQKDFSKKVYSTKQLSSP